MAKHDRREFDEENIKVEMAEALDCDPDDLDVSDSSLTSFREGVAYTVTCGKREYTVVEDDDTAESIAKAVVRQDLRDEPEIFNQSFLQGHINIDHLRHELYSDVMDSNLDYVTEARERDFRRMAEEYGIEIPEVEDEDGNVEEGEITDSHREELAQALTDAQLKDPMEYLEDIYGREEAAQQAMKIAGFDEDAAVEEAVSADGWQHFLCRYDGNSEETASGFVFWRDN